MLDVEELEQQWKKYNKRRKRPVYLVIVIVGIILLVIFTLNNKSKYLSNLISKIDTHKPVHSNNITENKLNNKEIYILNKYMDKPILTNTSNDTTVDNSNVKNSYSDAPLDENEIYTDNDIVKPSVGKKIVNIIKVSNNSAYKDVERRFRRTHNINDAIFLANMYYNKRNYKKAIYWSMQTNKLDKNIEESWLIFAKSKIKIGKKNEAIRVLRAYIKRSNSYEAKKLLKKIINR
jgi:tetratricopeptide (TPR) repeat protein